MTEENQKNTVATVGMIFSIIGLIMLITVILAGFGLPLLFIGFILGIIGLFYKPRGRARVAICIPLIVFISMASIVCWLWSSVKTPAMQFADWAKETLNEETFEDVDEDTFKAIVQNEIDELINSKSEDEWKTLFEGSTGSNSVEKASYLFFNLLQETLENSLEKYNNGELPEVIKNDDETLTVDFDIEENEDTNQEADEIVSKENVEVFTESEKNDIEQVLNILE